MVTNVLGEKQSRVGKIKNAGGRLALLDGGQGETHCRLGGEGNASGRYQDVCKSTW